MLTLLSNRFYVFLVLTFFFFSSNTLFAQNQAIQIVSDYAQQLKMFVETGNIKHRIALDKITPPNCLVNDVVAQHIAKENGYPAGTLRVADYYNSFLKWKQKGNIAVSVDFLEYQKNILTPGEMTKLGDTLHVVMGKLSVTGSLIMTDRVMYFVRGGKITKIISTGDGETLGKGIELYSNRQYDAAFRLFRKLANADKSAFMAQYWTAVMLLKGEGCQHIHVHIRRQEAIWWLERGRETNRLFLEQNWKDYRNKHNSSISYRDFVIQFGVDLTYNYFPEALRLMVDTYNKAGITKDDFPFYGRTDYGSLLRSYRPVSNGLMLTIDKETGLHGFVSEQNQLAIPCRYKIAFPFTRKGLAMVYNHEGKKGFINVKGEEVIPCIYDDITDYFLGHSFFAIRDNHLLVVTDKNEVIRQISGYDKLLTIRLDKYLVVFNPKTKHGDVFDEYGNIVIYNTDSVLFDITEVLKVYKDGKLVYSCYDNWR